MPWRKPSGPSPACSEQRRSLSYAVPHLLYPLHTVISSFNVFRYITFRTIYAAITALVICFVVGPWLIRKLRSLHVGQQIRDDGPCSHQVKQGTRPWGSPRHFAVVVSTLLWANLRGLPSGW